MCYGVAVLEAVKQRVNAKFQPESDGREGGWPGFSFVSGILMPPFKDNFFLKHSLTIAFVIQG